MSWIGVITGDIVNSTEILNSGNRDKLLATLHQAVEEINNHNELNGVRLEIYRGDSFQIIINNSFNVIGCALIIRALLITNSDKKNRWDARLGIGIGKGEYMADSIAESDGEAFRLSGQAFDNLDKKSRMAVLTPFEDFNDELKVSTAFVDDIISNWTTTQAPIINLVLQTNSKQKELAEMIGKSPQSVNKLLSNAKLELIIPYIDRFIIRYSNLLTNPNTHGL